MSRTMPRQKPGKSEQTVVTPEEFITAACGYLDIMAFDFDLAATPSNTKAAHPNFFSPEDDSLTQNWNDVLSRGRKDWAWLNPPYSKIGPWAKKCSETDRNIAMLVPASVGSNWWRDYVHWQCRVLFLNGRITFVGHPTPYPKDLALCLYCNDPGYDVWTWRNQ